MALELFGRLEDPIHPLLGPNLYGLRKCGLWQAKTLHNLIHILAFFFVLSQYVELWFIRTELELALRNLSVTMLSSVCVFKAATFIFWQNSWKEIIEFISTLEREQLTKNEHTVKNIMGNYTAYSRRVTYFYWCLVTATVFTIILAPLFGYVSSAEHRVLIKNGTLPYPEVLSSWVPFDRTKGLGYWAASIEHSLVCFYGGGVVATYDSNAVVIMSFIAGQLEILSKNCAKLFEDGNRIVTYDMAQKRIQECHIHHSNLVRLSTIFNSLLSPVMFLYVIICSLMICASAVQLTMENTSTVQRLWVAEYLVALIAQLFLYCWHGNEVLFMSNGVENGVYSSAWWSQNVRVRRSIILLGGKLRRPIIFTAGPFTKLNIAAFVAIMKGSYSYYTLLSKKED